MIIHPNNHHYFINYLANQHAVLSKYNCRRRDALVDTSIIWLVIRIQADQSSNNRLSMTNLLGFRRVFSAFDISIIMLNVSLRLPVFFLFKCSSCCFNLIFSESSLQSINQILLIISFISFIYRGYKAVIIEFIKHCIKRPHIGISK